MDKIKRNKSRKGEGQSGSNKTDIHVSLDNSVYDRLFKFQQDQIGKPSYSGIINTAIDGFMDDRGY